MVSAVFGLGGSGCLVILVSSDLFWHENKKIEIMKNPNITFFIAESFKYSADAIRKILQQLFVCCLSGLYIFKPLVNIVVNLLTVNFV